MSGSYRFLALDVETATSDLCSICQIGIAAVRKDGSVETTGFLVNPGVRFDPRNTDIHGINERSVATSPNFRTTIGHLGQFLLTYPVFQHSTFDSRAVRAACADAGVPELPIRWLDSIRIARKVWPNIRGGYGLANLAAVLGLDFHHHDAPEDARACAHVVLRAEADSGLTFRQLLSPRPKTPDATRLKRDGDAGGRLAGQIAVFTGALTLPRKQAMEMAARAGISVTPGVTAKTTLLIVGDQDLAALAGHNKSSKHRKVDEMIAAGAPIRIIGETEFMRLIADG